MPWVNSSLTISLPTESLDLLAPFSLSRYQLSVGAPYEEHIIVTANRGRYINSRTAGHKSLRDTVGELALTVERETPGVSHFASAMVIMCRRHWEMYQY